MDLQTLQTRASSLKALRSFFYNKDYLELDTPLLSPDLIPESCLEVFQTERLFPQGSTYSESEGRSSPRKKDKRPLWLIPSPEIWMKKIIALHKVNNFQICKCFRNGESEGHLHNSEFTMLEYYTMNADYLDSLVLTEELLVFMNKKFKQTEFEQKTINKERFAKITISQAFLQWAGFDLFEAASKEGEIEKEARNLGLDPIPGSAIQELYDLIFIHTIEPHLKNENIVFLLDYPAFVPCLAKLSPNGKTVERWELYYNGIELANCYSEETDPQRVKEFFISKENAKEKNAIVKHKTDHNYWKLFENGKFPKCSGVAMGVDRLIMALTGKSHIETVLPVNWD